VQENERSRVVRSYHCRRTGRAKRMSGCHSRHLGRKQEQIDEGHVEKLSSSNVGRASLEQWAKEKETLDQTGKADPKRFRERGSVSLQRGKDSQVRLGKEKGKTNAAATDDNTSRPINQMRDWRQETKK